MEGNGEKWRGMEGNGVDWRGLEENGRHLINSFDVFVIKGFTVQWSAFKLIRSQEISYSGQLLYQYNARRYHTVVGFYINKMKTSFLFKFFIFYKLFSNHKITTKRSCIFCVSMLFESLVKIKNINRKSSSLY